MAQTLDLTGLACPLPVIRTKEALEKEPSRELIVVVDNPAARDNVTRFAESRGCSVTTAPGAGDCQYLTITPAPGGDAGTCLMPGAAPAPAITVVVFASDAMGQGDPKLGAILINAFFQSLVMVADLPKKLLFYNRGVFLTLNDSPVLQELQALEEKGLELLVCGTCLDFYKVRDRLAAGKVSNMFTILESQLQAHRIIQP
jgi:selenium metabolism protein YedF